MNHLDVRALDGQSILVKPAVSDDKNSVGMRGTLRVVEIGESPRLVRVEIVLNFPEMSDAPAHDELIVLSPAQVAQVLESEVRGTFEFQQAGTLPRLELHPRDGHGRCSA